MCGHRFRSVQINQNARIVCGYFMNLIGIGTDQMPGANITGDGRYVVEIPACPEYGIAPLAVVSGDNDGLTRHRIEGIDQHIDILGADTGHIAQGDNSAIAGFRQSCETGAQRCA